MFTNYSLVLQVCRETVLKPKFASILFKKISQEKAGAYMCESSNNIGKGRSEAIILDVKCEQILIEFHLREIFIDVPVCKNMEPEIYGVLINERVNIVCNVEANPSEVSFK